MFEKPIDREVKCSPSAWDFCNKIDYRLVFFYYFFKICLYIYIPAGTKYVLKMLKKYENDAYDKKMKSK